MAALSGSVFLLTYWTVLVAELAGDRSIYMIASLTLRYSWKSILAGITLGFAAKMLVAVMFGHFITQIPGRWLAAIGSTSAALPRVLRRPHPTTGREQPPS